MAGMSRTTGAVLSGWQHVHQSIVDILTTPIGSRVMRRNYGSRAIDMIDRPETAITVQATLIFAEALERWEPRFKLTKVRIVGATPGHLVIGIEGIYLPDGHLRSFEFYTPNFR